MKKAPILGRVLINFDNGLFSPTIDDPPRGYEACRAHHSLPKPLHLRATFVDQRSGTASLEFEQGNPPLVLDLATR